MMSNTIPKFIGAKRSPNLICGFFARTILSHHPKTQTNNAAITSIIVAAPSYSK
jgi:hypothetical protein